MAEAEAKKAEPEQIPGTTEEKSEVKTEADPVEVEARRSGWTPKEEFRGDPDRWVDAKTWVDRAPMFDHPEFRKMFRKTRDLENTVKQLKTHYEKVEEAAYQRAVDSLKAEKLKALEEGDHKRVVEVDDELDRVRSRKPAPVAAQPANPEFERFLERNTWYERDSTMRRFADLIGVRYAEEHPEKTHAEVYEYVEKEIRNDPHFQGQFRNPEREKPSSVEGGKRTATKSATPRWSDLPEQYQRAGDRFVRSGVMTREQYIADLIRIGELKV